MANYQAGGNRWTAIFVVERERGDVNTYRKLPFEICRFNADVDPDAKEVLVPTGIDDYPSKGLGTDATPVRQEVDKVYEKIWIVDSIPFKDKSWFGRPE